MAAVEPGVPAALAAPLSRHRARLGQWALLGALAAIGLLLLWLSAVRTVGLVESMVAEGDDFTPYWNGATAVAAGQTPYGWLAENRPQELPDYIYPPLLALLLAPLTRLVDYPTARWGWLVGSALCVVFGVLLLWLTTGIRWRGRDALALVGFIGVLPSVLLALSIGQLSPLLLLVLAVAYAGFSEQGPRRSGGALGAAAVAVGTHLKTVPGLLGGYLLLRGRYRDGAIAAGVGLLLLVASVVVLDWGPHWAYLTQVISAQSRWFGGPFNVSLNGVFTRLLVDTDFAVPIVSAPWAARLAILLTTAAVLALSGWAIRRASADRAGEQAAIALAITAMLLVSPINGQYNLVLALIPLAVVIARVQQGWQGGLRWVLLVAILLSLPVEFAGMGLSASSSAADLSTIAVKELPWRQGWGILLTTGPLWGLLALWALLFRLCTSAASQVAASPASSSAGAAEDAPPR